jgi:hypothetical protein
MTPRGIRNNNPLNIRKGDAWLGMVDKPTDPEFVQFVEMVYGVRAAFIILHRYFTIYRIDTVEGIISRWAPPSENNTGSYIRRVCQRTGFSVREKLSFNNESNMIDLVDAMIGVECGCHIERSIIRQAYCMVTRQNQIGHEMERHSN